jgi:alanyl-tRNA synthetase
VDKESLRSLADQLKSTLKSGIVILAAPAAEGKVTMIVTVTPDLTKRAPAGQLVKQLAPMVGGGGGGRPDFAEAGGKDSSKIGAMLAESPKVVEALLARS